MEIQLAYAIGVAKPVSIACETFGTSHVPEETIDKVVRECFDLRPAKILENLKLRRPIYKATAAYGHFGRTDIDAPWEATDKVDELRALAGGARLSVDVLPVAAAGGDKRSALPDRRANQLVEALARRLAQLSGHV